MSTTLRRHRPYTPLGMPARDLLLAEFAQTLLLEWETVPACDRDLWLRRRLADLLDRRPGRRGRWI